MAKCPVRVPQIVAGKASGTRVCNCDVTGLDGSAFYKVEYSDLFYHHERSGKYEDVVGICSKHAADFAKAARWIPRKSYNVEGTVHGLRGNVRSVTVIEGLLPSQLESQFRTNERMNTAAGCKSTIKRMMGQKNTAKLTIDDWETLFEECIREFTVERVMES